MIVVESGGTKSTWVFTNSFDKTVVVSSVGLHPQELSEEKRIAVSKIIQEYKLLGNAVYFFGAGCESKEAKEKITLFLEEFSLVVKQVETDIYAACIAHLGNTKGIVGIIGTGAVAAYFDGDKVVQQTSGLGYILGDEGSGFDMGKRLLQSYYRNELTEAIEQRINEYFNHKSILHRIYESDGRMVVAGLTKIISEFRTELKIQKIVRDSFLEFCETALKPLNRIYPINFIGSVAYYFQKELEIALSESGFELGNIEQEAVYSVFGFLSSE